jgi:hypothetical protein
MLIYSFGRVLLDLLTDQYSRHLHKYDDEDTNLINFLRNHDELNKLMILQSWQRKEEPMRSNNCKQYYCLPS